VRTLNLGILAHVDAGKTSLTERLLFDAGVIGEIGSVDAGTTQTDTLALERQRGITIKAAVASLRIGGLTVNIIDTPGHPDFIAEVERALRVLDGAVLVISAVEGVQSQTRLLWRALQRLAIPTLFFVNKIDRAGADCESVLRGIASRLTPAAVAMGTPSGLGTRAATSEPFAEGEGEGAGERAGEGSRRLAEVLAEDDEAILAAYLADERALPYRQLRSVLADRSRRGLVHPVFFGSALTGAGVDQLTAGLAEFLPSAGTDAAAGPATATVFKVERGQAGQKIAYVRVFSGTLRVRDRVRSGRVTAIEAYDGGPAAPADRLSAGQIGKITGLAQVQVGDVLGAGSAAADPEMRQFAPPSLATVVSARDPADQVALFQALTQLAEQDPLISLRREDAGGANDADADGTGDILLSLYGEVQKEVIAAVLADDYGIAADFSETITVCIERPAGVGAAYETFKTNGNPFLARVGLRVEPGPADSGITFGLGIELGALPMAFLRAIEEAVRDTLRRGGLYGWEVTDCAVTLTHSGYYPRQSHMHGTFDKSMSSTAADFRYLTPLVLMDALARAGTRVSEPVHRFRLELPEDTVAAVLPVLASIGGITETSAAQAVFCVLEGEIPAAQVDRMRRWLPALTRGEGVLESGFERYQIATRPFPVRPRPGLDPRNRRDYLIRAARVAGRR
jgi:ribosomal protection tetracycline resistance protein